MAKEPWHTFAMTAVVDFSISLLQWLYGCAVCRRSPTGPLVRVCEHCMVELEKRSPAMLLGKGPERSPLWTRWIWNKADQDGQVGAVVHSLKGGGRQGRNLAQRIAEGLELADMVRALSGPPVWVPAPPRTTGTEDHAYLWAQALQNTYGGSLWAGIKRKSGEEGVHQKHADRDQRWEIGFELRREWGQWPEGTPIFCDDVVTSGATWSAAQKLIVPKRGLRAVTIAYRPLVNGA